MHQKATNVFWHEGDIKKEDRERLNNHRGVCIWFTGLSGSGKSTIAVAQTPMTNRQGMSKGVKAALGHLMTDLVKKLVEQGAHEPPLLTPVRREKDEACPEGHRTHQRPVEGGPRSCHTRLEDEL